MAAALAAAVKRMLATSRYRAASSPQQAEKDVQASEQAEIYL